jgi:hypothetical protein
LVGIDQPAQDNLACFEFAFGFVLGEVDDGVPVGWVLGVLGAEECFQNEGNGMADAFVVVANVDAGLKEIVDEVIRDDVSRG